MAGGILRNAWTALRRKRVVLVVAAVLVAGLLATLAAGLGQRMLALPQQPPPAAPTPSSTPSPAPNGAPAEFVEFRSEQAGFALSYPKSWKRLRSEDPQVALVAASEQQDSFLVRTVELNSAVGPEQLPEARKLTDQIVASNKSVKLLAEPSRIELGGLPGFFYFYSFEDPASQQTGAHSHFFVFDGKTMITIVFQAVPAEQFRDVAPTFDRITSSFRVL